MSNGIRTVAAPVMLQEVIPATPGYFVLAPIHKEAGAEVEALLTPVVAWALERDTFQPYPISLDGLDVDAPAILRPDGKVDRLGRESFSCVAEWLADMQLQFPKHRN